MFRSTVSRFILLIPNLILINISINKIMESDQNFTYHFVAFWFWNLSSTWIKLIQDTSKSWNYSLYLCDFTSAITNMFWGHNNKINISLSLKYLVFGKIGHVSSSILKEIFQVAFHSKSSSIHWSSTRWTVILHHLLLARPTNKMTTNALSNSSIEQHLFITNWTTGLLPLPSLIELIYFNFE